MGKKAAKRADKLARTAAAPRRGGRHHSVGNSSSVGIVLTPVLTAKAMTQADLAYALGYTTPSYVNFVMTGHRSASAMWLELVADTLKLGRASRQLLQVAGARDKGFKIDLT